MPEPSSTPDASVAGGATMEDPSSRNGDGAATSVASDALSDGDWERRLPLQSRPFARESGPDGEFDPMSGHVGRCDELSSLAGLVAAAMRDRVVLEQMEEIKSLRARLDSSNRVEVTGPNGCPVYARGNFAEGDFNPSSLEALDDAAGEGDDEDRHRVFWDVGLEMVNDVTGNGTVPLRSLADAEIRVGGCLYASTSEVEGTSVAFGIRPGNRFDADRISGERDMTRSAVAEINTEDMATSTGRAALLTFHLWGFPRGHWRSLQSVAMLNRSIALRQREREERREEREAERREQIENGLLEDGEVDDYESDYDDDEDDEGDQEPLDVYNYLTMSLSKRHPGQGAHITSVSFCVKSVRGKIKNILRGRDFAGIREKVLGKLDGLHRAEADGMETVGDHLEVPNNDGEA